MSFEEFRPILSGIVAAVCALVLSYALSRWIPRGFNNKSAETLVRENRVPIRVANGLFIVGIAGIWDCTSGQASRVAIGGPLASVSALSCQRRWWPYRSWHTPAAGTLAKRS
jgi:hypothetical protein